ncbi:acyl-CoA dehydrogenase family protein [Kocuria sp. CNJ-770]|uniref:acyl-CoA dehydrogenase family protein n=1 Tax=Kocuria sp. CNJ-770 TaxID=1904964 RepID=UPI0009F93DC3|nr:acyl-CoA dehydrogenase family protein [Kocuria sp. CNJ-770]
MTQSTRPPSAPGGPALGGRPLLAPLVDYPDHDVVRRTAAARAHDVDTAVESPWETLRELGARGLLDLGLSGSLAQQAAVVFDLATECTATAFSLWAHRATVEYLAATGTEIPADVRSGAVPGCSAMAPAFKDAAGIGEIPVTLTDGAAGPVLNGTVPWASNLYPEGVVVLPAVREDGSRAVLRTRVAAPGVTVRLLEDLMALNATASGVLVLEDVPVDLAEDLLSEDVPSFLTAVRGPFLLLQTAFCLGLSAAALTAAHESMQGVADVFREELEQATADHGRLRAELLRLAEAPREAGPRELFSLRLDAALLTGRATRIEGKVVGGRGYAMSSPTARRAREAAFLPVQSPTEGHLRWVLQNLA